MSRMLKIFIQGLKDGQYEIDQSVPADSLPQLSEEFFGDVSFKGSLRIFGRRYFIKGTVSCNARLECDISLTEYIENIAVDIELSFLADSILAKKQASEDIDEGSTIAINDDDKHIDITVEAVELLTVNLPMKRVAPKFRDKSFDEIYPQYSAEINDQKMEDQIIESPWNILKSLSN